MRRLLSLKIALVSLMMAACVTINVYFPAAAAEKAADQIIDAVTSQGAANPGATTSPGGAPPKAAPAPQGTPPTSSTTTPGLQPVGVQQEPMLTLVAAHLLDLLVPAASAQEANLDVSTPEVRAITASMQDRFAQLARYFDSGVVGLTSNGLVAVREAGSVPLAERASVQQLVAADNRDREALYAAIAKANAHPEWESQIRSTFARRWIERAAKPGWYYQNTAGAWVQK
jgi:uncharacterized protein YdbL (DUF1318 family)